MRKCSRVYVLLTIGLACLALYPSVYVHAAKNLDLGITLNAEDQLEDDFYLDDLKDNEEKSIQEWTNNEGNLDVPETFDASGTYGTLTWSYSSKKLLISGNGKMQSESYVNYYPWYQYYTEIQEVIIGDGVTSVSYSAFCGYPNLVKLTIGKNVSEIGIKAFYDCVSLTTVIFGNGLRKIDDGAFCKCVSLKKITIPDSVNEIGQTAFSKCYSLYSLTIGKGVRTIEYGAFANCTKLKNVSIAEGVTSIGKYMFYDCDSITRIALPNSLIKIEEDAFEDCDGLTTIFIPNNVISIGEYAFYHCDRLKTVSFGKSIVRIDEGAFYCCSRLLYVYYYGGESNWKKVSIGANNYPLTDVRTHFEPRLSTPVFDAPVMSSDSVEICWNSVNDATSYRLYKSLYGGSWEFVTETSDLSYCDNDIEIGNKYQYKVKAGSYGEWSNYSDVLTVVCNPFTDVPDDSTYFAEIAWAYKNGITSINVFK